MPACVRNRETTKVAQFYSQSAHQFTPPARKWKRSLLTSSKGRWPGQQKNLQSKVCQGPLMVDMAGSSSLGASSSGSSQFLFLTCTASYLHPNLPLARRHPQSRRVAGVEPSPCFSNFLARTTFVLESWPGCFFGGILSLTVVILEITAFLIIECDYWWKQTNVQEIWY